MPHHLINGLNQCAEEAVDDDIEKSSKTRKQVAMELYADKTPNQANQLFINTLNPNQEYPRMGAEQAIRICTLAGKASSYLQYVFDQLNGLLDSSESKDFLLMVFKTVIKKLCDDDAEVVASTVNESLGFKSPERLDDSAQTLEGERAVLNREVYRDIKALFEKVTKAESLNQKLRPLSVVEVRDKKTQP
jgi:hypothetical protein